MFISKKFEWSLKALAQPAKIQVALFPSFVNVADELALCWEEVIDDEDFSGFSNQVTEKIQKLDDFIVSISGEKNAHLWTNEALTHSVEWAKVRKLARAIVDEFGWTQFNLTPNSW